MLIYVAGPYNAPDTLGIQQNILNAARVAIACWRKGWAVICPHKNTAGFEAFEGDNLSWETWMKGDLEMLSKCEAIVMVPGWENSKGAKMELEYAKEHGIAVYYGDGEVPNIG